MMYQEKSFHGRPNLLGITSKVRLKILHVMCQLTGERSKNYTRPYHLYYLHPFLSFTLTPESPRSLPPQ